jgi:GntR family transcriptional regulator / MocR family aminotransferase
MVWIAVDKASDVSLIRQIYEQIRQSILRGELQAGERLPPTREVARDLHISRNVVLEAYDQLLAEGYIESRQGSGTYVSSGAVLQAASQREAPARRETGSIDSNKNCIDFRPGVPALDSFPRKLWGQLMQRVCMETPSALFGYDSPAGRIELRSALSRYLLRTRGVHCQPDQILITSGAAQAFFLLAQVLRFAEKGIVAEDPWTNQLHKQFSAVTALVYPVPVDENGMRTDLLPDQIHPGSVYVTPSHQFPLGGTLPIQRRIQLVEFARARDCYIIEDDYDSEFRYEGIPVSSLQGLDPERVVYVGTMSKILSPALRCGYLVLPWSLVEACQQAKQLTDLHSPTLDQLALAHFINEGHLERHVLKMKKLYRKRRECLLSSLNRYFADRVTVWGASTGLHIAVEFHDMVLTEECLAEMNRRGVRVYPVEQHTMQKGKHLNKIMLGYANLSQEEIEEGISRIKSVMG